MTCRIKLFILVLWSIKYLLINFSILYTSLLLSIDFNLSPAKKRTRFYVPLALELISQLYPSEYTTSFHHPLTILFKRYPNKILTLINDPAFPLYLKNNNSHFILIRSQSVFSSTTALCFSKYSPLSHEDFTGLIQTLTHTI